MLWILKGNPESFWFIQEGKDISNKESKIRFKKKKDFFPRTKPTEKEKNIIYLIT